LNPPGHWARRRRTRRDGKPYEPNHWHALLMETYTAAAWHWWQQCEAVAMGYETEEREFALEHPRPTLKDFMQQLSREWTEDEDVAA